MLKGKMYTKEQALKIVEKCYDRGEPVFIILGSDHIAPAVIKDYAEKQKNASGPDHPESEGYQLAEQVEKFAVGVLHWQLHNMDKVKLAD